MRLQPFGVGVNLRNVSDSMNISDRNFKVDPELRLSDDEVQVWHVDLEGVAPAESRWQRILSPDELARANRFHLPRDRQYFTATRALLRTLLGSYVGCDPETLTFLYSNTNKPALGSGHSAGQVEFNASHSGSKALLAFARKRQLGVDVEQIRNNFDHEALARRFFSPAEQEELEALQPSERCRGFFRGWTRKEAFIKAVGAGLSLPLDSFDVSLAPGEQNALQATRPDAREASRWSLREIDAGEGYEAALCVKGSGWVLKS